MTRGQGPAPAAGPAGLAPATRPERPGVWNPVLASCGVLAALAALLALSPLTWRADRLWQDLMVASLSKPAPDDTLIVAIDDDSIAAIGRWPWPRTVHATLLRELAAAGPRSITLDLVLSEPTTASAPGQAPATEPATARAPSPAAPPPGDADHWLAAEIAAAVQRGVPVLMPVSWQAGSAGLGLLGPTPTLRPHVRLGAAEAAVDADGVLRHLFLQAGPPGAPLPHLALAVLEAGGGRLHPSLRPAWNPAPDASQWQRDGRLLMRFGGPPGQVPRVGVLEVLQGRVPAARLAGRDLLIGLTAQGLGDTLATPVNAGHRAMPGAEVLAHSLALLRHGGAPQALAPGLVAAAAAAALALLLALMQALGERRALALSLGAVPLVLAAAWASAHAGRLWSPWPLVLPALLAYPLWSWLRLRGAMRLLDREIAALAAAGRVPDPAHGPLAAETGPFLPAQAPQEAHGLAQQIGRLQDAGERLRAAHRDQAALLEGLPTAVLVGDADGRVRLGNARAAALFEVDTAAELQGLDLPRLLGELVPAEAVDWRASLSALLAAAPSRHTQTAPGPGSVQAGADAGADAVANSLALEARLGHHELLLHARALATAAGPCTLVSLADLAAVREAQRAREEALAFVSHDLRGPAAAIVLLARLHAEGRSPRSADALMPELQQLAQRTLELADDFVLAARAQARPLQPQPLAPAVLADEALLDARPRAAAAGVTLTLDLASDAGAIGPRHWQLDRRLVLRALGNLLGNALRHTPAGGRVRLALARDGDALLLEVADSGSGLSAAQRRALAAGQAPPSASAGGSGFGLAFVLQVARRHGGALEVLDSSAAWPGARLRLRLRDAEPGAVAPPAAVKEPATPDGHAARRTI